MDAENVQVDTHQLLFSYQEDTGVCFEVDPFGLLDGLESFDANVGLICETEANEIEHFS